jgi:hypothetical protein
MIDRRNFLRLGAGAAFGLAARASAQSQISTSGHIRRYVRLGRTELKVSDISFGSASSSDVALVRHALDRGVNYFDTAESYRWGGAEEAIGEALQGKRDQVVLSSKTKAGASDTRADMMKALEGSLRRALADSDVSGDVVAVWVHQLDLIPNLICRILRRGGRFDEQLVVLNVAEFGSANPVLIAVGTEFCLELSLNQIPSIHRFVTRTHP